MQLAQLGHRTQEGGLSDGSLELLASDYPLDAHRLGLFGASCSLHGVHLDHAES